MNTQQPDDEYDLDDYANGLAMDQVTIAIDADGNPMLDAGDGQGLVAVPWEVLSQPVPDAVPTTSTPDEACPDDQNTDLDDGTAVEADIQAEKHTRTRPDPVAWIKSRGGRALGVVGGQIGRSPWYVTRGIGRVITSAHRWVTNADDIEMYRQEVKAANSLTARRAVRTKRNKGVFLRGVIAAVPLAIIVGWTQVGQWGVVPAVVTGVAYVTFHVIGYRTLAAARRETEPAHPTVTAKGKRPELSRPFITEALALVGFKDVQIVSATPTKGGERIVINLAAGSTVTQLVKRNEELAGALGRPVECVVIDPKPDVSPLWFELYIADKTLAERKPPQWAWSKVKARSFFDPVPVGVDAQGNTVTVPLHETHGLIGGGTGMGKSFTARLLLMAAACDPHAKLLIHNLKGGPDYKGFAPVAHSLRSGSSRSDMQALADDLAWVQSEISRRGKILESLPSELVREGKLTPQIARDYDMGPIILLIDEAQRAFTSKIGDTLEEMIDDVVRTARAVGVTVRFVTQGTKEGAMPSSILDQSGHRIGHGVTSISDANLTLGSDAHGRGYRAVDIDQPGIAYVGIAGGRMVRTMMAKVDLPDVERIVGQAAQLRKEAGTLTGMAAGVIPPDEHDGSTRSFLADVLTVWATDTNGEPVVNAASADIANLLRQHDTDEYGDITGADVSRRMGDAGVKVSSQRFADGSPSARGVRHANVLTAHNGA